MSENRHHRYEEPPRQVASDWLLACHTICNITHEVWDWIREQENVGEESITDWLLRVISKKIPFAKYIKFSRHQEARETGADWEWWFVSSSLSLGLRIQAKRLRPGEDHYQNIAFTNRYGLQIERLLESAQERNLLPLYCLYHSGEYAPQGRCPRIAVEYNSEQNRPVSQARNAIRMASAEELYEKFIQSGRRRIEAAALLEISNPLPCFFCCPVSFVDNPINGLYEHIRLYFPFAWPIEKERGLHDRPPAYVEALLEAPVGHPSAWIAKEFSYYLDDVNALLVFDLRSREGSKRNTDWIPMSEDTGAIYLKSVEGNRRFVLAASAVLGDSLSRLISSCIELTTNNENISLVKEISERAERIAGEIDLMWPGTPLLLSGLLKQLSVEGTGLARTEAVLELIFDVRNRLKEALNKLHGKRAVAYFELGETLRSNGIALVEFWKKLPKDYSSILRPEEMEAAIKATEYVQESVISALVGESVTKEVTLVIGRIIISARSPGTDWTEIVMRFEQVIRRLYDGMFDEYSQARALAYEL